jgi:hypothetical protein
VKGFLLANPFVLFQVPGPDKKPDIKGLLFLNPFALSQVLDQFHQVPDQFHQVPDPKKARNKRIDVRESFRALSST